MSAIAARSPFVATPPVGLCGELRTIARAPGVFGGGERAVADLEFDDVLAAALSCRALASTSKAVSAVRERANWLRVGGMDGLRVGAGRAPPARIANRGAAAFGSAAGRD